MHSWNSGVVHPMRSCERLENTSRTRRPVDEGEHMGLSQLNYQPGQSKTVKHNILSEQEGWNQREQVGVVSLSASHQIPQHQQHFAGGIIPEEAEKNHNFSEKERTLSLGETLFSSPKIIALDMQTSKTNILLSNIFNNNCHNGGCHVKNNSCNAGKMGAQLSDCVKSTTIPQETRAIVQHNYRDHAFEPYAFVLATEQNFEGDFAYIAPDNQQSTSMTCDVAGDTQLPFPERLYELLRTAEKDSDLHNVVSWQPHGRCFLVRKPKLFVEKVLTSHFRQTKFTSFQRQLNLYGFKRLTTGLDRGAYYHEFFLRGRPVLCRRIFRIRIKGNRVKPAPSPSTEPNFYKMKPCLESDKETFSRVVSTDSMEDTTTKERRRSFLGKCNDETVRFEPSNQINCEWVINNSLQVREQGTQDVNPSAHEKLLRNFFIGSRLQFPPQSISSRLEEVEDPLLDCSRFAALDPDSLKAYETKNLGILSRAAKRPNQHFETNSNGKDSDSFIRLFSKAA